MSVRATRMSGRVEIKGMSEKWAVEGKEKKERDALVQEGNTVGEKRERTREDHSYCIRRSQGVLSYRHLG